METHTIIDFENESDLKGWFIVDDVVMGGRSSGTFGLTEEGNGVFKGKVSLENNGGFSSVRFRCGETEVLEFSKVRLRVKGDGKSYQFRLKVNSNDYQSYIKTFQTKGEWEEVEIPLEDFYPSFRGRKLDMPNFNSESFEEISILIANKKAEEFELLIDYIELI